jgi:ribosomal protein S11
MISTRVKGTRSTQKKRVVVSSSLKSRFKFKPIVNSVTAPIIPIKGASHTGNFRGVHFSKSAPTLNNGRRVDYNQHYRNNGPSRFHPGNGGYNRYRGRYQPNFTQQVASEVPLRKKATKPMLFIFLKRTNNNIFMSLSYKNGVPLYQTSGGSTGIPGSKRDTPASAETAAKLLVKQVVNRGYFRCFLRIDGVFDNTVRSAVRGLQSPGRLRFVKLQHLKTVTHNGVRKSKPRRT